MIEPNESEQPAQRDYDDWKRTKIERGMAQACDRSMVIPIEQVLRELAV
ncbi:hypothetical protein NHF48_017765 [Sphingomonas sp. H160509]|nr:hypothetical protein [Sphingomonas sp. H160509]MDD1452350.1 hypothetical protein [Sphingomonas sp. H160509]